MRRAQHRFKNELTELLRIARKKRDKPGDDIDNTYTYWRELCELIPKLQLRLKQTGSFEEAHLASLIGRLAERAHLREALHAQVDRGLNLSDGGRKGARRRWPNRKSEREEWKAKYDELERAHPQWGRMRVSEAVAKEFGRSGRTIRSHIPTRSGSPSDKKIGK